MRYPGVDYSLDEVNRDHAKLNQADRRSDMLGIVKAASMAIIAIVILIALIVGGRYWIDGKQIDSQIAQSELALFESISQNQLNNEELTNGMILLVDKMQDLLGEENLRKRVEEAKSG